LCSDVRKKKKKKKKKKKGFIFYFRKKRVGGFTGGGVAWNGFAFATLSSLSLSPVVGGVEFLGHDIFFCYIVKSSLYTGYAVVCFVYFDC
jgi:hypothetical protein